jgi:hypothetical protein
MLRFGNRESYMAETYAKIRFSRSDHYSLNYQKMFWATYHLDGNLRVSESKIA